MKLNVSVLLFIISYQGLCQIIKPQSIHFESSGYNTISYLLYKPKDFSSSQTYPLLVYLHGGGSIGNNLDMVRSMGIPKLIEDGNNYPFIVIAPQLNKLKQWDAAYVDEFINHAIKNNKINIQQIHLTGISLGATGVWEYCSTYPSKVTSAIPISGWGNPQVVCKMREIPTWVFHGSEDKIVPPAGSKNMVSELLKCDGNVRLTMIEGGGHDIWMEAYTFAGFNNWLLSKSRSESVKLIHTRSIDDKTKAYKLPKALKDITGISVTPLGDFLGVNEKSSLPVILRFDTSGHIKQMIRVKNAAIISWQDITKSNKGEIFIADIGNRNYNRKSLQVYKILEKDLVQDNVEASKIEFKVDFNESLDFKSIFFFNENLYSIGESKSKRNFLVEIPKDPSINLAKIVGELSRLKNFSITSAEIDNHKNLLILTGEGKLGQMNMNRGIESILALSPSHFITLPIKNSIHGLSLLKNNRIAFVDQYFLGGTDGNLYFYETLK